MTNLKIKTSLNEILRLLKDFSIVDPALIDTDAKLLKWLVDKIQGE
jgi:hypothetical protein